MREFINMVNTARTPGRYISESRVSGKYTLDKELGYSFRSDLPEAVNEYLYECQPFIIDSNCLSLGQYQDSDREDLDTIKSISDLEYDSPFRVFSIELDEGPVCRDHIQDYEVGGSVVVNSTFDCIMFAEISPNKYIGYGLQKFRGNNKESGDLVLSKSNLVVLDSEFVSLNLPKVINLINTSSKGVESTRSSIKIKGHGKRRLTNVIHITNNKKRYSSTKSGKTIDYSFRFAVRGHWRELEDTDKVGKNRAGEYKVKGYTWVSAHIRGDESKPLIKKVRVVH